MNSYPYLVTIDRNGIDANYLFSTAEEAERFHKKMDRHYMIVDSDTWVFSPTQLRIYDDHETAVTDELDGEQLALKTEADENNELFRTTDGE
jgi:hypothetical protein